MQSYTLLLMTMQWVLIDLMTLDICGMVGHTSSRTKCQWCSTNYSSTNGATAATGLACDRVKLAGSLG